MKRLIVVISAAVLLFFCSENALTVVAASDGDKVYTSAAAVGGLEDISMKVEVNSRSAVLMEAMTGKVIMCNNPDERVYPASVTKIMSMLLICEAIDNKQIALSDSVTATDSACEKGGSQIWLEPGEVMTVEELLKATAVYSANDACSLLGEYIAGSEEGFVKMMNIRAEKLGMTNTHFDNCTGLDDTTTEHLTTAYDIALMSRELMNKHQWISKYTTIWMDSLRGGETELVNTNRLVRTYSGITGLKTGTTSKAGCCVSASAKRDNMSLIAVVMGSDSSEMRFSGAKKMLDWGFANYEIVIPETDSSKITPVPVEHGVVASVMPEMPELSPILTLSGQGNELEIKYEQVEKIQAPVEKGQTLGNIKVYLGSQLLGEYKLTAPAEIAGIDFRNAFLRIVRSVS